MNQNKTPNVSPDRGSTARDVKPTGKRRARQASAILWIVVAGLIGSFVSELNVIGGEFDRDGTEIHRISQID